MFHFQKITGIALDGFSGGGGAVKKITKTFLTKAVNSPAFKSYLAHIINIILRESIVYFQANNGQFFGQFIGKYYASLSAVIKKMKKKELNSPFRPK